MWTVELQMRRAIRILPLSAGILVFLIGSSGSGQSPPPDHHRRHALLVGVSGYCRVPHQECRSGGNYWWDLNTESDVNALRSVLESEAFGFKEEEIKVLKSPQETTHANIIKAFREFLIEATNPEDVVYFHFSGHGTEVRDDDDSVFNPIRGESFDGMDESLVPSDYKTQSDGSNNIRGDEISILLDELAQRHPASVTVTIDSCFAGTVTRGGSSLVRGASYSGPKPTSDQRGNDKSPSGLLQIGKFDSLGYVLMSATANEQLANENGTMGAFTAALVNALKNATSTTTYRDVFDQVKNTITLSTYDQTPQIEGPQDRLLMSGLTLPSQAYYPVSVEGNAVELNFGRLHGITEHSVFALYPPGTRDFEHSKPLKEAKVQRVSPTNTVLTLPPDPNFDPSTLNNGRAVETTHGFGDVRLKIAITDGAAQQLTKAGVARISSLGLSEVKTAAQHDWDEMICVGVCQNETSQQESNLNLVPFFTVLRSDGSLVSRIPSNSESVNNIVAVLEGEARWRFFHTLENDNPRFHLKMRLVPVTDIKKGPDGKAIGAVDMASETSPSLNGQLVLKDGATVMLELMNSGPQDAYVTVLDLRSDGTIAPLWPHPSIPFGNANDNKISHDGVWHRVPFPFVIQIGKPFGPEVFKAIATTYPSDFSPLLSRDIANKIGGSARGSREIGTSLGSALILGTLTRARGAGVLGVDASDLSLPIADWTTVSLPFKSAGN
jgi:Caspase domain